jgi:hypothetical protein
MARVYFSILQVVSSVPLIELSANARMAGPWSVQRSNAPSFLVQPVAIPIQRGGRKSAIVALGTVLACAQYAVAHEAQADAGLRCGDAREGGQLVEGVTADSPTSCRRRR